MCVCVYVRMGVYENVCWCVYDNVCGGRDVTFEMHIRQLELLEDWGGEVQPIVENTPPQIF